MVVLIILAVSLNLFGPMIEKLGAKAFLQKGLLFLAGVMTLIGLLLLGQVSSKLPYAILYPLVGVGSCVGWPACIFVPHPPSRSSRGTSRREWRSRCGRAARSSEISSP
jgi:sugar phosphate permease